MTDHIVTEPEDERQVLSGIRVLDLSRWAAGEFATKLFADFGADVVKVEKPGEGSFTRHWGPFPGDKPDIEASALFLHLNTNKRSIALDLHAEEDRALLLRLAATADAVVESFRPGHLERLGLGPDVLQAANPRLVVTRISAVRQDRPVPGLRGHRPRAAGHGRPDARHRRGRPRTAAQARPARALHDRTDRGRGHTGRRLLRPACGHGLGDRRLRAGGTASRSRPPRVVPAGGRLLGEQRAARCAQRRTAAPRPSPARSRQKTAT